MPDTTSFTLRVALLVAGIFSGYSLADLILPQ